jgi:transcriptional regulator with XRE-family HTH domain
MTPNEIKFRMAEKGIRQSDLARDLGKPPSMIHHVVYGRSKHLVIVRELARRLGVSMEDILDIDKASTSA